MIKGVFQDMTYLAGRKMMDGFLAQQRVHAGNIANVNTPGYKAKLIDFKTELAQNIKNQNLSGIKGATPEVYENPDQSALRRDGNNVNLEIEVASMEAASSKFVLFAKLAKFNLTMVKDAITKVR